MQFTVLELEELGALLVRTKLTVGLVEGDGGYGVRYGVERGGLRWMQAWSVGRGAWDAGLDCSTTRCLGFDSYLSSGGIKDVARLQRIPLCSECIGLEGELVDC